MRLNIVVNRRKVQQYKQREGDCDITLSNSISWDGCHRTIALRFLCVVLLAEFIAVGSYNVGLAPTIFLA